jgi:hypothetical protein
MRLRTLAFSATLLALAVASLPLEQAIAAWASERDPELGFTFSYPSELFERAEGDGKPSFHYFASEDDDAKFLVGGWNNAAGQSPAALKRWMMENMGGYDETTYRPRGKSWFVLSGYRGDIIYYEKVMFSCGDRLVSVFAITYPVDQRETYDPVVERMEDAFRPGSRCT